MTLVLAAVLVLSEPAGSGRVDGIGLAQDAGKVEELIRQLGSEEYSVREKASEELRKIGKPAEEALRKAAESDDPEIRSRAKSILDDLSKPQGAETPSRRAPRPVPAPPPAFGLRGSSVQVRNVNGDATYVLTPGDGSPAITFHKTAGGRVKLEYTDAEGKGRTAEGESVGGFLKDHAALAGKYGITEDGIDYGGARVSFKGAVLPGFAFRRPPAAEEGAPFEPASEALRTQLGLAADEGVVVGRDGAAPGLRKSDVLLEIDGRRVGRPEQAKELLRKESVLTVLRKGKRETIAPPRKDY